jgi:hypothetical protein
MGQMRDVFFQSLRMSQSFFLASFRFFFFCPRSQLCIKLVLITFYNLKWYAIQKFHLLYIYIYSHGKTIF